MPYSERLVVRARRAMAAELIKRLVAERRVVIPEPDEAAETEYQRAIDSAKRAKSLGGGRRPIWGAEGEGRRVTGRGGPAGDRSRDVCGADVRLRQAERQAYRWP